MTIFEITLFWITIAPSYYWLMYALGFLLWFFIVKKRWIIVSSIPEIQSSIKKKNEMLDSLFLYIFLWVVLWWRFWYVLFYNFSAYLNNPFDIIKVWEWWMSFHWWVIWVIVAMLLFSRKYKINFLHLADQITLVLPIWLWLGRIWNYLNWELLWYSWYYWKFAIVNNWIWYFPSTLLEALLEWLVLFIILNIVYFINNKMKHSWANWSIKYWFDWQIATMFLIIYAVFRLFVEIFYRVPDVHIWYIFGYFTMWEILTLPMLVLWIIIYKKLRLRSNVEHVKVNVLLKPLRWEINDIDTKILLIIRTILESWIQIWKQDFANYIDEALSIKLENELNDKDKSSSIVDLLQKRFYFVGKIGRIKKENNISVLQPGRWKNVLIRLSEKSTQLWLDEKLIISFWEIIHEKALELENNVKK